MKNLLRFLLALLILIPLGMILMIRFTPTTIKKEGNGKIIFGYDQEKQRFQINEYKTYQLDGTDGPYLIDGMVTRVNAQSEIKTSPLQSDTLLVRVGNRDKDAFYVHLNKNKTSLQAEHLFPSKLIAISDIEGNFNGFSSFLQSNGVIDKDYHWTFGDGALVLVGDFVDRGKEVLPVLWLIYQLEQEAKLEGGQVHFILGNHEILNFQGQFGYAKDKYKKIAEHLSQAEEKEAQYRLLFSERSELGRWMRTKNVIEKVGEYIFVHAGISPAILPYQLSLEDINTITRNNWDENLYTYPSEDKAANFLIGRESPIWYRGMAMDYKYYDKISEEQLAEVLAYYKAEKVVIGHTVVDDVTTDFDGRIIKIDLKHGKEKHSGKTKGLLIENGVEYKVDDLGKREKLAYR